jgi:FMN phosphatase YigB (HAD superfamily)
MRVRSFDVFDTLLTRRYAVGQDLFAGGGRILRERGLTRLTPAQYASARVQAELESRRAAPSAEANIEEIYTVLASRLGWSADLRAQALEVELELERQSAQTIPGMIEAVAEARNDAEQILFLSDMYLPEDFLRRLLEAHGLWRPGDELIVSGTARCAKATGQMFAEVRRRHPDITQWVHLGDNPHADDFMARRSGVEACLVRSAALNRYEAHVRGSSRFVCEGRSLLAGAMRLARLQKPVRDQPQEAIWDVACGVVGPLLFGFTQWCLEWAVERGIERVYFVSRDGQILHRTAQEIVQRRSLPLCCDYLHGSRQAWLLPGIDRLAEEHLQWILRPTAGLDLEEVFGRMGLRPENFLPTLNQAGFPPTCWREPLVPDARRRLGEVILAEPLRSSIERVAAERRALAVRYLRQRGFEAGAKLAIVDIGWHGNLLKNLHAMLRLDGLAPDVLAGLYFGLLKTPALPQGVQVAQYWNAALGRVRKLRRQNLAFFEVFTSADHGSVMSYEADGQTVQPILQAIHNEGPLRWGLNLLQEAVLTFSRSWLESAPPGILPQAELQVVSQQLFELFYRWPSEAEALVWGAFPYSDQQVESRSQGFIPDWTHEQVLRALIAPSQRPLYWWMEGTQRLKPCLALRVYLAWRQFKHRLADSICT